MGCFTDVSSRARTLAQAALLGCFVLLMACLLTPAFAYAEGSMNLADNNGYRPYTERYGATTSSVERKQMMWSNVTAGEHVMLGTSVWGVQLDRPDYADSEIHIKVHADGTETGPVTRELRISVDNSGTGGYVAELDAAGVEVGNTPLATKVGCIENRAQEKNGPNAVADAPAAGYTPIDVEIDADLAGMWEIEFYSKGLTNQNPVMTKISDTENFEKDQKGSTLAAWDITITDAAKAPQNGRVYTHKLFLNMGGNKYGNDVLKAKVWVYTDDGFSYSVDFNGMDPYGFIFFANNRGLLYQNANGSTQSLYHSVVTRDNQMNGLAEHNILLNLVPTEPLVDKTYKIFFNEPDATQFPEATTASFAGGTVDDLKFEGSKGEGETYVGDGGKFSFTAVNPKASSYKIKLSFTDGSVIALGNNLVNGVNEVVWDGKDGHGHLATPENTITDVSMEFNGGETHFPMMDVENNHNGIKIENVTPNWDFGTTDPTLVYYDNVNDDPDKFSTGWNPSISGWTAIGGGGDTHVDGTSSSNGALAYGSSNQFDWPHTGNQAALDLWSFVSAATAVNNPGITILDEPTGIVLKGTKKVVGREITATYDFEVKEGAKVVATGKNDANGAIAFSKINYTAPGTHTYTITEKKGTDGHIAYDTSAHTVTVVVTADSGGNLSAEATYGTAGDTAESGATFTNVYTPGPTTYTVRATKDLVNQGDTNRTLQADEFSFNLLDSTGNVISTTTNDAAGAITFDTLTFDKVGTYTYYVQEVPDAAHSNSNWVCDTSRHAVNIRVQEVNEELIASADLPEGGVVIRNLFRESTDSLIFWGNKNLSGRNLQAGEFNFGLYLKSIDAGIGTAPAVDPEEVIYTASNDQTGAVIFNWISYGEIFNTDRAAGDTYTYAIREYDDGEAHITYDTEEKLVYVHVYEKTDNGVVSIVAESSVPVAQGDVAFTNKYTPEPTSVNLVANKTYTGAALAGGDFTFQVKDSAGKVVTTAKNDAAGVIDFGSVAISEAGQQKFYVTEVAGSDARITYDSAVKAATVDTVDDAGILKATVTWSSSTAVDATGNTFTNTFTPDPGDPNDPGDSTNDNPNDPNNPNGYGGTNPKIPGASGPAPAASTGKSANPVAATARTADNGFAVSCLLGILLVVCIGCLRCARMRAHKE